MPEKSFERNRRIKRVMSNHTKRWKSALFCNSINSIISRANLVLKKNYLQLIISFNFSNKACIQKDANRRPFDSFAFDTQNQFAYLKVYYIASINRLKIEKNSTIQQKNTTASETFTEAVIQRCFVKQVFLRTLKESLS